jgi:hypothetical protein
VGCLQGRNIWDVPTAEGLTVRVINNVIKKCEVKQKFYESFKGDGYPEAFIYRQRVVILFQKIDGVDVALYCMYVQEYGHDSPPPNRNCVYLSYIDSVKYFRPEVPCSLGNNISLRTFVYHQILQGYLQFVKGLGFEQMYIWACPPLAVRVSRAVGRLLLLLGQPKVVQAFFCTALAAAFECPAPCQGHCRAAAAAAAAGTVLPVAFDWH